MPFLSRPISWSSPIASFLLPCLVLFHVVATNNAFRTTSIITTTPSDGRSTFVSRPYPPSLHQTVVRSRKHCYDPNHSTFLTRTTCRTATTDYDHELNDGSSSSSTFSSPMTFSSLGLDPRLLSSIESQGWEHPTPIQQMVIPTVLHTDRTTNEGDTTTTTNTNNTATTESTTWRSLWAEAPTGSGKTAAFALPLLQRTIQTKRRNRLRRLVSFDNDEYGGATTTGNVVGRSRRRTTTTTNNNKEDGNGDRSSIITLVLSPTRELALQIGGVLEELVEAIPSSDSIGTKPRRPDSDRDDAIDVVVLTGGVPLEPQIEQLLGYAKNGRNIDVVVATPGRLVDILRRSQQEDVGDTELERRLLRALDGIVTEDDDDDGYGGSSSKGKRMKKRKKGGDASLGLAQIEKLGIDETIRTGDDGGRGVIADVARGVRYLVFDEADRLLGREFRTEIDELLEFLPRGASGGGGNGGDVEGVETYLFSATFPEHVVPRVETVLRRLGGRDAPPPLRLSCSSAVTDNNNNDDDDDDNNDNDETVSTKRRKHPSRPIAVVRGPDSTIQLRTIRIEEKDRTQALKHLLLEHMPDDVVRSAKKKQRRSQTQQSSTSSPTPSTWDKVLVFVSTRYQTTHIAQKLRRASIPATELHGKLSTPDRIRALKDFHSGKTRVLIATDLASRGLDVVGLPAVVNYDLPRSTADFVHRVGRTGRAGRKGDAVSFVTPAGEAHFDLIEERHLGGSGGGEGRVVREVLEGFKPDEEKWEIESRAKRTSVEGVAHSKKGLAHDQMFGGVKGRRKSKKDRLREKAALEQMRKGGGGDGDGGDGGSDW